VDHGSCGYIIPRLRRVGVTVNWTRAPINHHLPKIVSDAANQGIVAGRLSEDNKDRFVGRSLESRSATPRAAEMARSLPDEIRTRRSLCQRNSLGGLRDDRDRALDWVFEGLCPGDGFRCRGRKY